MGFEERYSLMDIIWTYWRNKMFKFQLKRRLLCNWRLRQVGDGLDD
jgi:hypothetical protein